MSEQIKFYKGMESDLPARGAIEIGALYHCVDTNNTYLGVLNPFIELEYSGLDETSYRWGLTIFKAAAALGSLTKGYVYKVGSSSWYYALSSKEYTIVDRSYESKNAAESNINNLKPNTYYYFTSSKGVAKTTDLLPGYELYSSAVGKRQVGGGMSLDEGDAHGVFSFASGTSNTDLAAAIAGIDIKALEESFVGSLIDVREKVVETLGERAGYMYDQIGTAPIAEGEASITHGSGNNSLTALGTTVGVANKAGARGFYIYSIVKNDNKEIPVSVPNESGEYTNIKESHPTWKITLSTTQGTEFTYNKESIALTSNKSKTWNQEAQTLLNQWTVCNMGNDPENYTFGDKVTIILNGSSFTFCGQIISIENNGIITIDNASNFLNTDELAKGEASSGLASLGLQTPYAYSIINPIQPTAGLIDLHFGSTATGLGSMASGTLSQAHGNFTLAAAPFGFAAGKNTTAGHSAFVTGEGNQALGRNSFSSGGGNLSQGSNSHTEGWMTKAIGAGSHAEGKKTTATFSGNYGHAEGMYTEVTANAGHAEGLRTTVSGVSGHAEGSSTVAKGEGSHAEGKGIREKIIVEESGDFTLSPVSGDSTLFWTPLCAEASNLSIGDYFTFYIDGVHSDSFMLKDYEWESGECYVRVDRAPNFEVPNGTLIYTHLGPTAFNTGDHAEGGGTQANGPFAHAEGYLTKALNSYAHAEGYLTKTSAVGAHVEGKQSEASGTANYAHAEGMGTYVSANAAHAEGTGTRAESYYTHAEGEKSKASAQGAHAEGYDTIAKGKYSHAEGYNTTAEGKHSHAEGYIAHSIGENSHAEGNNTIATGLNSHAEGLKSHAVKDMGHAEGNETKAYYGSHAEGLKTIAGDINNEAAQIYSHAEGKESVANGYYSHAEGYPLGGIPTTASGSYSHAEGGGTKATSAGAHSQGIRTIAAGEGSHAEGNGTSHYDSTKHGTSADGIYNKGDRNFILAFGKGSHAEGVDGSLALGDGSHAEGSKTIAKGSYSHSEGQNTTAKGQSSHAEGGYTKANESYSHAEGYYTEANGLYSHAEGFYTKANGLYSHAEGYYAKTNEAYSHAEGYYTEANGLYSHAEGFHAKANGPFAHAQGCRTTAQGQCSHVEGISAIAYNSKTHGTDAESIYNSWSNNITADGTKLFSLAYGGSSHSEGMITLALGDASHSEGSATVAFGEKSHAEGEFTVAKGKRSHAEGWKTIASIDNCHVQGTYNYLDADGFAGNYAHIVGNGTSDTNRSNAHTLDWNGNAWYQGSVHANGGFFVGGTLDLNNPVASTNFSISANGRIFLTEGAAYGTSFPEVPIEGQIFFLKA